jgi:outer membrane protein assembly factor BamB
VVNAYDTWTGKLLWSDVLDLAGGFDEVAGGIAFQSGQVFAYGFVVSERGDLDVLLRAYDARTGALLWQDQVDKAQRTEFFASFWFKSLAADRGRVTIAASSAILHPDDRIDSDWIVRTYDASHPHKDHHHHHGYDGHDEDHDGKEDGDDRD